MKLKNVVINLLFFLTLPLSATGLWWAVGSPLTFDQNRICRKARRLAGKQQDLCKKEPEIIEIALLGSRTQGLRECRYQMKLRKWNCTSMSLGKVLLQATAVKLHMRTECKCHGLSGTCSLKTCWKRMPSFRDVGNRLKELFNGAIKVTGANNGKTLLAVGSNIKAPTITDLVYSVESPNFCEPDRKVGSIGTADRVCNSTSDGVDGCDIMCCNRGFTNKIVNRTYHCRCRFKWCCVVECDICRANVTISRCNGYNI
ncbi:protein Wnt-6-like [Anneissia japonica]|uniref:protein Wnt-6-like n=1 Tax=Anneissia japonica TaxID=1529436 RepID=UPI0014255C23|nr:protein Wnt-6-like [Anneissia japonica]